ncbi:MAG: LytR C-terminal domain-containing protein [Elusimicrobia bacterium]|nr:LytR C-terminal domain-containing protein [Elusimicrobiota bacterium]
MESIQKSPLEFARTERKIVIVLLVLLGIIGLLHTRSRTAQHLSFPSLQIFIQARPSLFLNYQSRSRTLDMVFIPKLPSTPDPVSMLTQKLLGDYAYLFCSMNLMGTSYSPDQIVRAIKHNPPRVGKILLELRRQNPALSWYDLLLMIWETLHLSPKNIRPAWFPENAEQMLPLTQRLRGGVSSRTPSQPVTMEILNGSGKTKLAQELTRFLRNQGIDVVYTGNYKSLVPHTQLLDRSGNWESAESVKSLLNLQEIEIWTQIDLQRLVDVSLILGTDFGTYPTYAKIEGDLKP